MRRRILVHIAAGCVLLVAQSVIIATAWTRQSPLALVVSVCAGVTLVHVGLTVRMWRALPDLGDRTELVEGMFYSLDDDTETPTVVEFYVDGLTAGFRNPSGDPFPARTRLDVTAPDWFAPFVNAMNMGQPEWDEDEEDE